MGKRFLLMVVLVGLVAFLGACGKISKPDPIEGSGYPHSYPRH